MKRSEVHSCHWTVISTDGTSMTRPTFSIVLSALVLVTDDNDLKFLPATGTKPSGNRAES